MTKKIATTSKKNCDSDSSLKLKSVHQTVEPDRFKIKFGFRFRFSNFFSTGSAPVRVHKIIAVNTGLRIRFGFGLMPWL